MSMNHYNNVSARLADLQTQDLWRSRWVIDKKNPTTAMIDGKMLIHFCSNDYLNLSTHPDVLRALTQNIEHLGAGSGSSALIAGHTRSHQQLEERCAEFLKRDRALLFNSGYHANLGVLTTLADRHSMIIADKYCHASLIDGIILSRAKHVRYQHNDYAQAASLVAKYADYSPLIVTESIFSMQGDIAPVAALANLACQHHATLIVDDAHGFGVLGEQGGGICEALALNQQTVPCLITPFGKAVGGLGAVVSGSHDLIELLIQSARTYRYTTALPSSVCHAAIASIKIIQQEAWRRQSLCALITYFNKEAPMRGLRLTATEMTPIKSILFGDNRIVIKLQKMLFEKGFLVSCIRPPTVPAQQALIRISLNCLHTENQIAQLLDTLADSHAVLQHDAA